MTSVLRVIGEGNQVWVTGAEPEGGPADLGADWVVRAQDGEAEQVLGEIAAALAGGRQPPSPGLRIRALYAQAVALEVLDRTQHAVPVARALLRLCRDLGRTELSVRAAALLAELLRRAGDPEQALDQLAHAVALEPRLQDLHDPQVQVALGALSVALRLCGVVDEARRIEDRLAPVEPELPLHQRVSRASNLALEHAAAALAAARSSDAGPDPARLDLAVAGIEHARRLSGRESYLVVEDEATVLRALRDTVTGDPEAALAALDGCRGVLDRGPEAIAAQLLWATARVRVLLRLDRPGQAAREGRELLPRLERLAGGRQHGDRLALAFELLRAEEAQTGSPALGARAYLTLAEERARRDGQLLGSLFRSRVAVLRSADERRVLARAASLDSLTGLVNRRGAAAAISAAAGRPDPVSVALLLIDLDDFGRVNELCGHLAGDVVLQRAAAAIRSVARPPDVVARWNGDQFLVIAELEPAGATDLAGRIRDLIRDGGEPGADDAVTASVGVALRHGAIADQEWLHQAELALYTARRSGGDAVALP